jgi:tripartite-type tricarboxylate transporter receptor subunit TctC
VPAGTPRSIVQKLHAAVAKAFEDPEMRELWFKLGAEPGGASPEEFRDLVARDVAKWGRVVRDAKITVE